MKKLALACYSLFLISSTTYAQSNEDSALKRASYLFDEFVNGSVLLKSGEVNQAPLNYNSTDQSIIFRKEEKVFTLTGLDLVDTIYMNERVFVPVNNTIYEIMKTTGKIKLFVSYSSKMRPWTAGSDHNGTSRQTADQVNNTLSEAYLNRLYKGEFTVEIIRHYWLKDYRNFFKANTARDFLRVFRESANPAISNYISENHIDFKNEGDLIKLTNFCNSLQ